MAKKEDAAESPASPETAVDPLGDEPNSKPSPPAKKPMKRKFMPFKKPESPIIRPSRDPVTTTVRAEDIFDSIGRNVAHKLRIMDSQQRIIAEKIIGDALYYGQLKELTRNSHIDVGDTS